MSYVFGLLFADGGIEDVRNSSRTCYIHLWNKDKSLIEQVRDVLSSNHSIYVRKPRAFSIEGRTCYAGEIFYLRIGNKMMYQDLLEKGLSPRKSLIMSLPFVPKHYFHFFLRGYFDGDGCVSLTKQKDRSAIRLRVVFTSGSFTFLNQLAERLQSLLQFKPKNIYSESRAFNLKYSKREGLKILDYMYNDSDKSPYLKRKYEIYRSFIESCRL